MAIDHTQMQAYAKQYGQLVARAWGDEAFKQRLLAEQVIDVPPGVEVRVHESTDAVVHLTPPPKPAEELSDEQLEAVAGGDTVGTAGTMFSIASVTGCMGTLSTAATAGTTGSVG